MNTPRKTCPTCKTENEATALECQNCGAMLNDFPTGVVAIPDLANAPVPELESFIDTSMIPEDGIGIHVAGASKTYYLSIYRELIIGRPTDATMEAVLDLSELGAYSMGVSRRHAKIRRTATGCEVMDLGSRNGSWLNAERLIPTRPYPCISGSQLRIGKMRLLIVYPPTSEKRPRS